MSLKAKELEMQRLEEARQRGEVDEFIDPWLDKLNAIENICTLQSCAGHEYEDGTQSDGHLWIWPCARIEKNFFYGAFRLLEHDHISEAALVFSKWGQVIISIRFVGKTKPIVDASLKRIVSFFEHLDELWLPSDWE